MRLEWVSTATRGTPEALSEVSWMFIGDKFRTGFLFGLLASAPVLVAVYVSGSNRSGVPTARSDARTRQQAAAPIHHSNRSQREATMGREIESSEQTDRPRRVAALDEALRDERLSAELRNRIVSSSPGSEKFLELCIEVGRAYAQFSEYGRSDQFHLLVLRHASKDSPQRAEANFFLGWNRVGELDRRGALGYFEDAVNSAGATQDILAGARYKTAVLYEAERDPVRAKRAYEQFLRESTKHLGGSFHPFIRKALVKVTGNNLERDINSGKKPSWPW